jgi:DNA-binding LytR/AlgR family response regulator
MIKIAICEDEKIQQQELQQFILNLGIIELIDIQIFNSGEELVRKYEAGERFSIILLDMKMGELDGIQTAEIIRKLDNYCLIIIITSIMEYAIEGYHVDAYDFILKPVNEDKFNKLLRKAIQEIQVVMNKLYVIHTKDRKIAIKQAEIVYIESARKQVIVHTREESFINNVTISKVESELVDDGFIRISRYYLINVIHIKEIGVKTLLLTSGEELKYSKKYADIIEKEYIRFMMGDTL